MYKIILNIFSHYNLYLFFLYIIILEINITHTRALTHTRMLACIQTHNYFKFLTFYCKKYI